jgi:hypothetical protein
MKNSTNIKKLKKETKDFSDIVASYCDKIKKDYKKILQEEKSKLIALIAEGEDLDETILRDKYLNKTKKKISKKEVSETIKETIFDKTNIDGIEYWYEPKEDGNVYNIESKVVGTFKSNKISIFVK